ncbi:hypothetical protein F3Y22_tig00110430pilonHSYRG00214 [Hibiscus syriacus]|uniref:Uncharacterized protein n=1 Tax=Hibiscus syriacus TaxID=106335 RepID=A0A6A3AMH5_HIBSY|nr:hypothetical protein F3Y22_tig00110430pilonHSYRG00214 [Hibiscus syriacus]
MGSTESQHVVKQEESQDEDEYDEVEEEEEEVNNEERSITGELQKNLLVKKVWNKNPKSDCFLRQNETRGFRNHNTRGVNTSVHGLPKKKSGIPLSPPPTPPRPPLVLVFSLIRCRLNISSLASSSAAPQCRIKSV